MRERRGHQPKGRRTADGEKDLCKTLLLRIPARMHRALRVRVAEEGTTIRQWVTARIEDSLRSDGLSMEKQP